MATMTDMSLTPAEAKEANDPASDAPKYPYGLSLCLNDESLERLKLDALPAIGSEMTITARVRVTGVREYSIQTEKEAGEPDENVERSVDLQITALSMDDSTPLSQRAAAKLYK